MDNLLPMRDIFVLSDCDKGVQDDIRNTALIGLFFSFFVYLRTYASNEGDKSI